jgi:hypothetical protein
MTKSIKQLRQELEALETSTTDLARELEAGYGKYFHNLENSVGKQLILASYQICTQKYPENFLKLSFNNRHKLQEQIKYFKFLFKQELAKYLLNIDYLNQETIKNLTATLLKDEPIIQAEQIFLEDQENNQDESSTINSDSLSVAPQEQITPDTLIKFHLQIEQSIQETLKHISQTVNRYLQKECILPAKLPPKILDMALQAEENASVMSSSPNLLSLLIETEQNKEGEQGNITPITAVCMRLSEIEFSDPSLAIHRHQIRDIITKIEKISEQYHKKQQQYAIAEAEAAWRSSWSEN